MKNNQSVKYCFGLITWFLFSIQSIYAQSKNESSNPDSLKSFVKIRVSWHIGVEWEKKISKASVVNLFAGIGVGRQTVDFFDYNSRFIISPVAFAEYRNYYNLFRRINNHKKTARNSANFFFGKVETILPVHNQNYFNLLFAQGWGAQRSLSKKIIVDCHIGVAEHFYYDKPPGGRFHNIKLDPLAEFSISYVF